MILQPADMLALIDGYMARGAICDRMSDRAFAAGDQNGGTRWGNKAIAAYTRAEELALQYDEGD